MSLPSSTSSMEARKGSSDNGSFASYILVTDQNQKASSNRSKSMFQDSSTPVSLGAEQSDSSGWLSTSQTSFSINSGQEESTQNSLFLPTYTTETVSYASQIIVEDDETEFSHTPTQTTRPSTPSRPSSGGFAQELDYYRPQRPQVNTPPSPATQKWSAAASPEERLRLGLPMYKTKEERQKSLECECSDK